MFSVPAFRRVNFSQDERKMATYGETGSRQAVEMANRKTEREEKTESVGVRRGLPPLTLFPLFVSALSSLYLSLSRVSALLSDATLQSKSAIATSRESSVSRTNTGVFTI